MSRTAVVADELVKTYPGEVRAVQGISFAVARGEAFGLLGPNGAGKSTTIGMLNSTVRPTSGRAFLAGIDVARHPLATRAVSSVVFQDPVVDGALTGRQNLELHLKLWRVRPLEGRSRLAELAEAVGITELLDRPVDAYSGGQRRRLEIVRALLSSPEVLFMDEPTVGLDTRIRHDLFDVIARLRELTGVTIIMTTHYLDEAERLCDRIAVVAAGRMVACDSPAALLAGFGDQVLEVRAEHPEVVAAVLGRQGIGDDDVTVIGSTVTAALRGAAGGPILDRLGPAGAGVRTATTRPPTLDDVYLRLTGATITGAAD